MKHFYLRTMLLFACVVLLQLAMVQAQDKAPSTLTGTVVDSLSKQPLPGAVIRVKGTSNAVSTDKEGKFSITTKEPFPFKIIASYIGYTKREITATGTP